jgi:hypothetical protein
MSSVSNFAAPPLPAPPPCPEKTSNIALPVSKPPPAATATTTIPPTPPPEQPPQARAAPSEPPAPPPPSLAELGISKMQSSRWQAIAAVPDEAFEDHIAGIKESGDELTTAGVFRLAKRQRNQEALATVANRVLAVPTGVYSCIVIDPPWPMEKMEREVRPNQVGFEYPTMSEDELAAFPVPDVADDDCPVRPARHSEICRSEAVLLLFQRAAPRAQPQAG